MADLPSCQSSAAAIIIAHNHPSSDASPSPQDVRVTREVCKAGKLLSIELLDHLVIGDGSWVGLKRGRWPTDPKLPDKHDAVLKIEGDVMNLADLFQSQLEDTPASHSAGGRARFAKFP